MSLEGQRRKANRLRELHAAPEILVLLNTPDAGSARVVEAAGFPAIATSSAGVAWLLGYPDGERIEREEMFVMVHRIARAVSVPVTADAEGGYGRAPEAVAETIRLAVESQAVGVNLEDSSRDADRPLLDATLAVERVRAARESAGAAGVPVVINARTDGFLRCEPGRETLAEAVRRGNLFLEAGADSVFVPGTTDRETIGLLVAELDGPLNILANPQAPPVRELEALGVARVSVGGLCSLAAMALFRSAAEELRQSGTYGFAGRALLHRNMDELLGKRV